VSRPTNYVVRNSKHERCRHCGQPHEFISRLSKDSPCGTPVAFSRQMADKLAAHPEDVQEVPNDTLVVLDPSARKLPQNSAQQAGKLAQHLAGERLV
jgi:ribosomal protein L37E